MAAPATQQHRAPLSAPQPGGQSPRWRRALLPNLASIAAVTALFCTLFLYHGYRDLFRDTDTGRHIQTGEQILETGRVPYTDGNSFSRPGYPFFDWEWLADVAMAGVQRAAGLSGIALFYGAAFAFCVWLWMSLTWQVNGNVLVAAALLVPMLAGIQLHLLARPHLLSWILLLATVLFFEKLKAPLGWRQGLQIFLLTLVWANLHASFFLAIVIGCIYTFAAFVSPRIWSESRAIAARGAAQATLLAFAATFFNPYSWHLYAHLIEFLRDHTLFDSISEYRSYDFHAPGSGFVIGVLACAAAAAALAFTQKKLAAALLCLLFFTQALRTVRMIPLAALVVLPLANGIFSEALRSAAGLRPALSRWRAGLLQFDAQVRQTDSRALGWLPTLLALVLAGLLLRLPAISAQTGFAAELLPDKLARLIDHLPANARLFSTDGLGSYLIYRFGGRRKVFFDGRGDFYGPAFFAQYGQMVQLAPGWKRLWNRWRFSDALLPAGSGLIGELEKQQWTSLYHDARYTLLRAPERPPLRMPRVIER